MDECRGIRRGELRDGAEPNPDQNVDEVELLARSCETKGGEERPNLVPLLNSHHGDGRRFDESVDGISKEVKRFCHRHPILHEACTIGQLPAISGGRAAKGTAATVNSDHLLPQDIHHRRWQAGQATLGVVALQRVVRELICRSAHSGGPVEATSQGRGLIAWVKSQDGETYLAIATEGFLDPREVAVVLNAVPGMTADDWQVEPGEVLGITPGTGQLVYSAMLPPESLAAMLDDAAKGYLWGVQAVPAVTQQ